VHRATLLGFPSRRVGFILSVRRAHLYSGRVGHRAVCVVERLRHLMYLFLARVRILSCHLAFCHGLNTSVLNCLSPVLTRPTLPVMAGGDRRGKRPHGRGSHHDVSPPSTRQPRMDVSPSWVLPMFRWVPNPRHCSSGFVCFVVMLNPTHHLV
jgi:hypothetical protein